MSRALTMLSGATRYLDVLLGHFVQDLALSLENLGVLLQEIGALHAFSAGDGANLQANMAVGRAE